LVFTIMILSVFKFDWIFVWAATKTKVYFAEVHLL
jgi:hypothetical protein